VQNASGMEAIKGAEGGFLPMIFKKAAFQKKLKGDAGQFFI
jgi:hypothetical protein